MFELRNLVEINDSVSSEQKTNAEFIHKGGQCQKVFVFGVVHSDDPKTCTMVMSGSDEHLAEEPGFQHMAALYDAWRQGAPRPAVEEAGLPEPAA